MYFVFRISLLKDFLLFLFDSFHIFPHAMLCSVVLLSNPTDISTEPSLVLPVFFISPCRASCICY